jgi:hypothetical protein
MPEEMLFVVIWGSKDHYFRTLDDQVLDVFVEFLRLL